MGPSSFRVKGPTARGTIPPRPPPLPRGPVEPLPAVLAKDALEDRAHHILPVRIFHVSNAAKVPTYPARAARSQTLTSSRHGGRRLG